MRAPFVGPFSSSLPIRLHRVLLVLALLLVGTALCSGQASAQLPGTIAVNQSGIVYYAQSGDTLISIAQKLTTRSGNWIALEKINAINKDSNIPIGTGIVVPAELLADEPTHATVIARSGSITATARDGSSMLINVGSKIVEGTNITTAANSFLTLALADQSRVSIPSNSNVLIAILRKTLYTGSPRTDVKLLRGRVASRVSPFNTNRGRFEIHTPLSVAGVRGTTFRVSYNEKKTTTEVLEGKVLVNAPQVAQSRTLTDATGNVVQRGYVGPAVNLLPAPMLLDMPYRQNGAAKFAIANVDGARGYRIQIAQDAEMLNLIAEAASDSREVFIDRIQEGQYFIALSAVDRHGLEGMPRTLAINIKNRVNGTAKMPAQPAPSVVSGSHPSLNLRWAGSPIQKYNVQVARDEEFTWLLYNTSVIGTEINLPRPSFGTYFSRVQSINADGSVDPFSFAQTLIVTDQWIINDGQPLPAKNPSRTSPR